jgi:hypothetical protein
VAALRVGWQQRWEEKNTQRSPLLAAGEACRTLCRSVYTSLFSSSRSNMMLAGAEGQGRGKHGHSGHQPGPLGGKGRPCRYTTTATRPLTYHAPVLVDEQAHGHLKAGGLERRHDVVKQPIVLLRGLELGKAGMLRRAGGQPRPTASLTPTPHQLMGDLALQTASCIPATTATTIQLAGLHGGNPQPPTPRARGSVCVGEGEGRAVATLSIFRCDLGEKAVSTSTRRTWYGDMHLPPRRRRPPGGSSLAGMRNIAVPSLLACLCARACHGDTHGGKCYEGCSRCVCVWGGGGSEWGASSEHPHPVPPTASRHTHPPPSCSPPPRL